MGSESPSRAFCEVLRGRKKCAVKGLIGAAKTHLKIKKKSITGGRRRTENGVFLKCSQVCAPQLAVSKLSTQM
jgi:hypothetical protein